MNVWDIVIGAIIVLAVVLAVRSMVQARKAGGCATCPYAGTCHRVGEGGCEGSRG